MEFFSPFFVGRFSVLEDDARGDFLSHPIARNLIEAKTVAVALKKNRRTELPTVVTFLVT